MIATWGARGPGATIAALAPAAWFRYGQGITVATGVSRWADQSVNGNDLLQAVAGEQPALQADGSILFDGVDDFLKCGAFALVAPFTYYFLFKQLTWTNGGTICDGNATNSGKVMQAGASPQIYEFVTATQPFNSLALNTYGAMAAVFNDAASVIQVGASVSAAGNPGAATPGGFTLGWDNSSTHANIQVKEVIVFAAAHDAATRNAVIAYLSAVGGL